MARNNPDYGRHDIEYTLTEAQIEALFDEIEEVIEEIDLSDITLDDELIEDIGYLPGVAEGLIDNDFTNEETAA